MGFYKDLEYSQDKRFDRAYENIFKNVKHIEAVEDIKFQSKGVDKLIKLHNGKVVTIEEKLRRSHWGDICLELKSNVEKGTLGWLYKIEADFLAYMTPKGVYFLPVELLKTAWNINKDRWIAKYGIKKSRTENKYTTEWIAIPDRELLQAIYNTMYFGANIWS